MAQTTISAWENGKRQNPRAVELSRVATSLSAHRSVTTVDDATSRKELLWQEIRATAGKDKSPQHALPEMRRRSSEEERLAANRKVAGSSPAVGISDDHIVTRPHGED